MVKRLRGRRPQRGSSHARYFASCSRHQAIISSIDIFDLSILAADAALAAAGFFGTAAGVGSAATGSSAVSSAGCAVGSPLGTVAFAEGAAVGFAPAAPPERAAASISA